MQPKRTTDDDLIAALREHGSQVKAAKALGLNRRTVERRMPGLAAKGWSPEHDMTRTVPDGFRVRGTSTLYDEDGKAKLQWVKSQIDPERQREIIDAAMAAMVKDLPRLPRIPMTVGKRYNANVMACYPIGDPHIGMRAWAEECGQDWDLSIAERVHCGVMADLVNRAPDSETATIVNLGDLFHYDSMDAVTPRSGHLLDADGRYAKIVDVGILVMRQCIESALLKHKRVRVINAPGNHDPTGALWLSRALRERYHANPRVEIDLKPSLFTYFEFGKVLVGVHHGHTCKAGVLPGVMANDQAEAWGRTKHRYWWTGHVHHESVKEFPGCSVETFNTNAPADAYATAGGWRSREQSKCVVLHRELGEVARLTSHPAMLEAA
jgi:UDP-2,3-diacylglucosamine pyrophosphatase LpxH